jgi:hypothetical protein
MRYGQSRSRERLSRHVTLDFEETPWPLDLVFEPYQSLLVRISREEGAQFVDLAYRPPEPIGSV